MSDKLDKSKCSGCRNSFYNQPGNSTKGECWSLDSAQIVTRFELDCNTPMDQRNRYIEMQVPHCYHKVGAVYLKEIPGYAK